MGRRNRRKRKVQEEVALWRPPQPWIVHATPETLPVETDFPEEYRLTYRMWKHDWISTGRYPKLTLPRAYSNDELRKLFTLDIEYLIMEWTRETEEWYELMEEPERKLAQAADKEMELRFMADEKRREEEERHLMPVEDCHAHRKRARLEEGQTSRAYLDFCPPLY